MHKIFNGFRKAAVKYLINRTHQVLQQLRQLPDMSSFSTSFELFKTPKVGSTPVIKIEIYKQRNDEALLL